MSSETKTELHISNLDLETDPGKYVCNGTNSEGTSQAVIVLRVRNRFAALWPFLGIVAEVLVLVTVIFIYEKRRKPDEVLDGELTRPSRAVWLLGGGWATVQERRRRGCCGVEGLLLGAAGPRPHLPHCALRCSAQACGSGLAPEGRDPDSSFGGCMSWGQGWLLDLQ